jgi:predicted HTH transcriptional regulator
MNECIFISSVQKELAAERAAVARHVRTDPLLRRFFDVFLFEELPPRDRRADDVYLEKVEQASIYLGLFGNEYGSEDAQGVSPTEREFDRATARGIERLILIKGDSDSGRHPKMASLARKAASQLVRRRFGSIAELLQLLQDSLVTHLEYRGVIQNRAFEERPCPGATLSDIDPVGVARFVRQARSERQFPLPETTAVSDVLTHLHLHVEEQPSFAAILLFGRAPHRFIPAAEVRCMHFHGTEIARPAPSYQVFNGNLFDSVDQGADFVLSKLNRTVGTREQGPQAPVSYEIPPEAVREAIVNAVAHRDYVSAAAVQVSVFADRVEVWNPGQLPPELSLARLREPHASVARNARICEALFLARYIEKYGTGTLMMIRACLEHGLPEPEFKQQGGEFIVTLWRDRFTGRVLEALHLSDRQARGVAHVKQTGRITNSEYQQLAGVTRKTAARDLDGLIEKGVLERLGEKRGAYYVLAVGK